MTTYSVPLYDRYDRHFRAMARERGVPVDTLLAGILMDMADDDREAHRMAWRAMNARRLEGLKLEGLLP